MAPKANIEVSIVSNPTNAVVSKELLDQLESLRKKAVDIGKVIREQLSSAWTSAHDASTSAVKTMNTGLGSLQKIAEAQDKIGSKAREQAGAQVKFLSGMGDLGSKTLEVAKNIVQLGTDSGKAADAVDKAFVKIEMAFKTFSGSVDVFNKVKEQLELLKQFRNVDSPAKDIGPYVKKGWSATKSGLGWTASKAKSGFAAAATKGDDLLGDISPRVQKAIEDAATKLKSLVSAMGSKLRDAASVMGEKFGGLGTAVGGALGKVGAFFGGLTAVAAGLVAVIAAAVAYIGVKLDEMFNNGRVLRKIKGWGRQIGHYFGTDLPTGESSPEDQRKAQETAERKLAPVVKHNEVQHEVRSAQREYFAARGLGKDFDKYDLDQANNELDKAETAWEQIENRNDSTNLPALRESRLAAYDHFKEAQEHILETTRETTKEFESQLATQRQQVTQSEKLLEQEKARFQGRKADFARLPKKVQEQIVAIGNKLGTGKDLSDAEAELSDKYGFFKAATTKHYADKVTDEQARALQRGGESGVEAALKAVADAKAKEKIIQEGLEASVQREQELTARILKARIEIAKIKSENLGERLKVSTELPHLGTSAEIPKSPVQGQHGGQPAAVNFVHEWGAAMTQHLVPAIHETMRRTAAQITNAG